MAQLLTVAFAWLVHFVAVTLVFYLTPRWFRQVKLRCRRGFNAVLGAGVFTLTSLLLRPLLLQLLVRLTVGWGAGSRAGQVLALLGVLAVVNLLVLEVTGYLMRRIGWTFEIEDVRSHFYLAALLTLSDLLLAAASSAGWSPRLGSPWGERVVF